MHSQERELKLLKQILMYTHECISKVLIKDVLSQEEKENLAQLLHIIASQKEVDYDKNEDASIH